MITEEIKLYEETIYSGSTFILGKPSLETVKREVEAELQRAKELDIRVGDIVGTQHIKLEVMRIYNKYGDITYFQKSPCIFECKNLSNENQKNFVDYSIDELNMDKHEKKASRENPYPELKFIDDSNDFSSTGGFNNEFYGFY